MTALQASIGSLNDLVDAPRDAGRKPGKPIPAGLGLAPARRRAVVVGGRGVRTRPGGPVRAGDVGAGRRRPRDRLRLRPRLQGDGLVVGPVRGRHPAAAGLRLARGRRDACRLVRGPRAGGGARRRRRWPSPTPGPTSSATGGGRRLRSRTSARAASGPGSVHAVCSRPSCVASRARVALGGERTVGQGPRRSRRRGRRRPASIAAGIAVGREATASGANGPGSSRRSVSVCSRRPGWRVPLGG